MMIATWSQSKWNFRGGDLVKDAELIEYCNLIGNDCPYNCKYEDACSAYVKKYGAVPYLDDDLCPENYTDEVIVAESEDDE